MRNTVKIMFIFSVIIFLFGCEGRVVSDEDVFIENDLGTKVKASIHYGKGDKAVILLHMLGKDKNDWEQFSKKLDVFRITTIAIDLSGHGESDGDWRGFSDKEFNDMIFDVKAAKKYLEKKGKMEIGIVGASMGANLALNYAAIDSDISSLVLLSPGIDYKGINVEKSMRIYENPILIISSEEDIYPTQSSKIIYENVKGEKSLKLFNGFGHGTDMIVHEDVQNKIFEFLNK